MLRRLATDEDIIEGVPLRRILCRELRDVVRQGWAVARLARGSSKVRLPYLIARSSAGRVVSPLLGAEPAPFSVSFEGRRLAIFLRKTQSDLSTFTEVFVDRVYEAPYERWCRDVSTVVDLGSNIGLSPLFFHARFQRAKVLCVEPVAENAAVLRLNRGPRDWIVCEEAVSHDGAPQDLFVSEMWASSTTVPAVADARRQRPNRLESRARESVRRVPSVTIPQLLQTYGLERVDVMKMDVEGTEADIFGERSDLSWLRQVAVLVIDVHAKYVDASHVESVLARAGFRAVESHDRVRIFSRPTEAS